jgi:hypothetical protein
MIAETRTTMATMKNDESESNIDTSEGMTQSPLFYGARIS